MKKLFARSVVALAAALSLSSVAQAQVPPNTSLEYVLWDPGVSTSLAFNSGVMSTHSLDRLRVAVDNTAGTASRTVTIACMDPQGGTTALYSFDAVTVTTAQPGLLVMNDSLSTTTNRPTGATFIGLEPCHKTKISVGAGGTGTIHVVAYGRKGR